MIPEPAPVELGKFTMSPEGPLVAGTRMSLRFRFEVGAPDVKEGAGFRLGIPNTGWERPVVPQQRYWDELVKGSDRRLAPFHPVNTTASTTNADAKFALSVMERMLTPDEDPAIAYWRWWITLVLEEGTLSRGDSIEVLYGDRRFGSPGALIQTFPEPGINASAFLDPSGAGDYLEVAGSPLYFDVIAGEPSRAHVVWRSVRFGDEPEEARIAVTDRVQAVPTAAATVMLGSSSLELTPGKAAAIRTANPSLKAVGPDGRTWGVSNPWTKAAQDGLNLYWGDLHAQSEHHVMHSQRKDFRQATWSKGISCGTLDECYAYGREVSLLDFVAITDQGACLTEAWEYCQEKVRDHHEPGRFVVFKGYEAGSPLGHRNVIYLQDEVDKPFDAAAMNNFHPETVYELYRGRHNEVLIIPHHVKTWTDWDYHDPDLEPLMEVYSCWGQSETPGPDLWNKGQTPGAGAWEAFRRGYRMGMMASTDNHVGMPGRSYPGDRQIHTPFKGGLCAVWAEALTREALFGALRARHCYGTTGARIIIRFSIDGRPMGSMIESSGQPHTISYEIHGTDAIDRLEIVGNLEVKETVRPDGESDHLNGELRMAAGEIGSYYLRLFQKDGERAWTSPIWID